MHLACLDPCRGLGATASSQAQAKKEQERRQQWNTQTRRAAPIAHGVDRSPALRCRWCLARDRAPPPLEGSYKIERATGRPAMETTTDCYCKYEYDEQGSSEEKLAWLVGGCCCCKYDVHRPNSPLFIARARQGRRGDGII